MTKIKLKIDLSKDKSKKGIWQYAAYLAPIETKFQLSLMEGNTPEVNFSREIVLKREDLNPTGSLKDRGMAYLISRCYQDGLKNLVLSSSGNAAISSAVFCDLAKINLVVFVPKGINNKKLKKIEDYGIEVISSLKPVSETIKFAKQNNFFNLRPSKSDFGSEGYQTIAFEIAENQGLIEDIFLPVSSGVALVGIAGGFKKLGFMPRIHVCQGSAICPIASVFDQDYSPEKENLADSLVARYTPLKKYIVDLVKESSGTGWVIGNERIIAGQKILKNRGIETSNEGALVLAAMLKAKEKGTILGKTVCLLTGKKY